MARCGCSNPTSCGCSLTAGSCISITGVGTVSDPFIIDLLADSARGLTCGVSGVGLAIKSGGGLSFDSGELQVNPAGAYGGTQLARATRATSDTNKTTVADITSMSVSFTLTQTRWVLFLAEVYMTQNTAGGTAQLFLTDSLNNIIKQGVATLVAAASQSLSIAVSLQLAAATHTYKLRATTTAGTLTPVASSGELMFLAAYGMGA